MRVITRIGTYEDSGMFFSRKVILPEIPTCIVTNEETGELLPLVMQPGDLEGEQAYKDATEIVKHHLSVWMQSDLFYVTKTNRHFDVTLSHQIYCLSLPFLPTPRAMEAFAHILSGNGINSSGTRLIEACIRATSYITPEAFKVITGRFLYAMTETTQQVAPTGDPYPSKEEWVALLTEVPWVPYLQFIQELYETDATFLAARDKYFDQINAEPNS